MDYLNNKVKRFFIIPYGKLKEKKKHTHTHTHTRLSFHPIRGLFRIFEVLLFTSFNLKIIRLKLKLKLIFFRIPNHKKNIIFILKYQK